MKKAVEKYLSFCGYDIVDPDVAEDIIVAYDPAKDQMTIIKWGVSDNGFEVTPLSNEEFEKIMMSFFLNNDAPVDVIIRHDVIDLRVIKSTRCLIRHHINVFGGGDHVDI